MTARETPNVSYTRNGAYPPPPHGRSCGRVIPSDVSRARKIAFADFVSDGRAFSHSNFRNTTSYSSSRRRRFIAILLIMCLTINYDSLCDARARRFCLCPRHRDSRRITHRLQQPTPQEDYSRKSRGVRFKPSSFVVDRLETILLILPTYVFLPGSSYTS